MKQLRKSSWSFLPWSILLLAVAFGSASCKGNEQQATSYLQSELPGKGVAIQEGEAMQAGVPVVAGRKIVYTGMLSITVASYGKARIEIDRLLKHSGGFIARGESQGSGDYRYATLTLRVPTSNFASLSSQLKTLGKVHSESIAADDVTEQHVDISARLANARTLEARLLELVVMNTDSVAELLLVEAELGRVREQVERLDAQLRNMDDQVAMATLTLSIDSAAQPVGTYDLGDRMSGALAQSYQTLGESGANLLIVMSTLLPWTLLFGLVSFVFLRIRNGLASRRLASSRQV